MAPPPGIYANISVGLPADKLIRKAGALAELVYIRTILFSRENLTDGVIDDDQLGLVCYGIRGNPRTHATKLQDVGLFERLDGAWAIPLNVWRIWNPTAAEVTDKRDKKARAGAKGNHKRWHDKEPDPDCEWCNESQPDRTTDRKPVAPATRVGSPEPQTEPEPQSEPKGTKSSSVLTVVPDPPAGTTDDDDFEYVIGQIVAARELEYQPRRPRPWRLATRRNTITEDGDLIERMLSDGTPRDQVALFVLGHGITAEKERNDHGQQGLAWCDSTCPDCNGDGWAHTDQGLAPCPGRTS